MISAFIFIAGFIVGGSVGIVGYGTLANNEMNRLRKHNVKLQKYNVDLAMESHGLQERIRRAEGVRSPRTWDGE